jgi:hypothetical protein
MRFYLLIGLLAVLVTGGFFGYRYVNNLQSKLDAQIELVTSQKLALESTRAAIDRMNQTAVRNAQEAADLEDRLQASTESLTELRRLLQEHDLTRLALEKPGLIERRINDATDRNFNDIEQLTRP